MSEDPIGFDSGDTNHYRYSKNSPIAHKDPSGKSIIGAILIGIGIGEFFGEMHSGIAPDPDPAFFEGERQYQEWVQRIYLKRLREKWENKTGNLCGVV